MKKPIQLLFLALSLLPTLSFAQGHIVKSNGLFGYVGEQGDTLFPVQYKSIQVDRNYILYRSFEGYGLGDVEGNRLIPPVYEYLSLPIDGFSLYYQGPERGALTPSGKNVLRLTDVEIEVMEEGFAMVTDSNQTAQFIDLKGENRLFPSSVRHLTGPDRVLEEWPQVDGVQMVKVCEYVRYIEGYGDPLEIGVNCHMLVMDHLNDIVTEIPLHFRPLYDHEGFQRGLLRVKSYQTGKVGMINTEGEWVLPPIYDALGTFSEGMAFAYENSEERVRIGYVDREGDFQILLPNDLAISEDGCYLHGGPMQNGEAELSMRENGADCWTEPREGKVKRGGIVEIY